MCQLPVMSVLKFFPSFPFIDLLIQSSCDLKSLTIKAQTKVKSRPPRLGKQWNYAARTHCARRLILSLEGEGRLGPGMSLIPSYLCSCSLASCSRGMGGSLDQWAEETEGVSTVVLPRTFPMLTSMKSSGFPICLSSSSVQADVKVARENQTPDASASISRF